MWSNISTKSLTWPIKTPKHPSKASNVVNLFTEANPAIHPSLSPRPLGNTPALCLVERTIPGGLVALGAHAAHLPAVALLVQLLLGAVLDGADVGHRQPVPPVRPAEHLPVEVREQPPLALLDEVLYPSLRGVSWLVVGSVLNGILV